MITFALQHGMDFYSKVKWIYCADDNMCLDSSG